MEFAPQSNEKKCRFEELFSATVVSGNDAKTAAETIENRNFEPYSDCKAENRVEKEALKWYNILGTLIFVSAAISMIAYLRKKDDA